MPAPVDLIDKLRAAGGTLRVTSPEPDTRAAWRRVIHAAKETGLVPAGYHLRHHGRDHGDLLIELSPGDHPGQRYWTLPRHRIELPDADAAVHPIVQTLAADERRLRVTPGSRSRAHRLIHALVAAAEQLGHTAHMPESLDVPGVCIVVGRWTYRLVMEEEWDTIQRWPEIDEPGSATYSWQRVRPEDETVPSGRLVLSIADSSYLHEGRRRSWADRQRWRLDDKLPDILAEILARAEIDERRELDRVQAEQDEQRRWEAAVADARKRWTEDRRIHEFTNPDTEPTGEDLRPYLKGWSPYEPKRGYRR